MGNEKSPDAELTQLLQERQKLATRLAALDAQLATLEFARFDALCTRLGSLETAGRSVIPAPVARSPEAASAPAPAKPAAVPAAVARAPEAVSAPAPRAPEPPTLPTPATPTPHLPNVVGEALTGVPLPMSADPGPASPIVGWIPPGARILLTDEATADQNRVVYGNRPGWVPANDLVRNIVWNPPQPTRVPAPQAVPPAAASRVGTTAPMGDRPPSPPQPPSAPPRPPASPQPVAHPTEAPPPRPGPTFAPPPQHLAAAPPQVTHPEPRVQLPPPPERPPARPARPPVWSRPGFVAKVLALVGAAVTLIGVTFLLILAAQNGYFGPEARTISAALLAIALVVLAFVVRRRDPDNVGAPVLAATGVAAGYLSVVTATAIYGWLPPAVGVTLAGLIGIGGMLIARRWQNQWVALIAVLGSLVLAVFVGQDDPVVTAALMVVLTGVTLWVERGTGWRLFPFARVLPTALVLLAMTLLPNTDILLQAPWVVVLTTALALLGLASVLMAPSDPPIGQVIALSLLVPMAAPAAIAPSLLGNPLAAGAVLAVIALAFAVTGLIPVVAERVRWAVVPLGAGFVTIAVLTATQNRFWQVLAFVLGSSYLAVAAGTRSRVNLIVGALLAGVGLAGWLPISLTLFSTYDCSLMGPEQIAQSLAGIAAVITATLAASRWITPRPGLIYLPWAAAIIFGTVATVHAGTWVGGLTGNTAGGFQTGHALVTSAWMVLCVLFLHRGLTDRQRADAWLRLALVIAALAVAKLFLLDLNMLDALARVGAFLVVGLLLLFVGTRYAKAWERAHSDDVTGPVPPAPVLPEAPGPGQPPATTATRNAPAGGGHDGA